MTGRYLAWAAACACAAPLIAQEPSSPQVPTMTEWQVPWERTRPRDPFMDRQGHVWFVGQAGNYVAMLDPATGRFRRWELDPGTGPHNLIVDGHGIVWYAGNRAAHIGRLDPATGAITKYPMPDSTVRDPHTLVFDRRGDIWFTAQGANVVGRLTVATGEVRLVRFGAPHARPYGIMMDPQDRPWIVLFGTNRLATVDPATFVLREFVIPRPEARPRRIAITSDGAIWYGDYAAGMLGRFDPRTERFEEWPLPGGPSSRPYAVMQDDRDRIWVFETGAQPNTLVGFDARARHFLPSASVPSGGGTVRHMVFDQGGRALWFGTDAGTIGRAVLPPGQPGVP